MVAELSRSAGRQGTVQSEAEIPVRAALGRRRRSCRRRRRRDARQGRRARGRLFHAALDWRRRSPMPARNRRWAARIPGIWPGTRRVARRRTRQGSRPSQRRGSGDVALRRGDGLECACRARRAQGRRHGARAGDRRRVDLRPAIRPADAGRASSPHRRSNEKLERVKKTRGQRRHQLQGDAGLGRKSPRVDRRRSASITSSRSAGPARSTNRSRRFASAAPSA